MRPTLLLSLLGLALLGACGRGLTPGDLHARAQDQGELVAVEGKFRPMEIELLERLTYPHELHLRQEREVFFPGGAVTEGMREELLADGSGLFDLDLRDARLGEDNDWMVAPNHLLVQHADRGRYLVLYRDLQVRNWQALAKNYDLFVASELEEVVGINCVRFRLVNKHGYGSADLVVTMDRRALVLGWELRDHDDAVIQRLVTTELEFEPELVGFEPDLPAVPYDAYNARVHDQLLGFTPERPDYLPSGYLHNPEEERVLHAQGAFAGVGSLHVAFHHDGLRPLFVVQHVDSGDLFPADQPLAFFRRGKVGGVTLVEGVDEGRAYYVVSGLGFDELLTIFGSLTD